MPQAIRSRQSTHGTAEVVGASVLDPQGRRIARVRLGQARLVVYENDQQRCYTLGPVLHRGRGGHLVAKTPPKDCDDLPVGLGLLSAA
jgi:hypothetical protein